MISRNMNANFKINLLVLKSSDMERSAIFYSKVFDIGFEKHSHGNGPIHYASKFEIDGLVFEIYLMDNVGSNFQSNPKNLTRIGFEVESISNILENMKDYPDLIISKPKNSEWGLRAVISDPDGHRIELTEIPYKKDPADNPSR